VKRGRGQLPTPLDDPRALGALALEAARSKGGEDPVLLEVSALTGYADLFLIVSGRSDRQVRAIADAVREALGAHGRSPIGSEGLRHGQWALVDYGDLVVHVFHVSVRAQYDLESLWIEAPRLPLLESEGRE